MLTLCSSRLQKTHCDDGNDGNADVVCWYGKENVHAGRQRTRFERENYSLHAAEEIGDFGLIASLMRRIHFYLELKGLCFGVIYMLVIWLEKVAKMAVLVSFYLQLLVSIEKAEKEFAFVQWQVRNHNIQ